MVAPDAMETPMSVASAAAEPYVPTPASTVRSTGKENETHGWANGRPNHWLSDHRNPMYGQVCIVLPSSILPSLVCKTCAAAAVHTADHEWYYIRQEVCSPPPQCRN